MRPVGEKCLRLEEEEIPFLAESWFVCSRFAASIGTFDWQEENHQGESTKILTLEEHQRIARRTAKIHSLHTTKEWTSEREEEDLSPYLNDCSNTKDWEDHRLAAKYRWDWENSTFRRSGNSIDSPNPRRWTDLHRDRENKGRDWIKELLLIHCWSSRCPREEDWPWFPTEWFSRRLISLLWNWTRDSSQRWTSLRKCWKEEFARRADDQCGVQRKGMGTSREAWAVVNRPLELCRERNVATQFNRRREEGHLVRSDEQCKGIAPNDAVVGKSDGIEIPRSIRTELRLIEGNDWNEELDERGGDWVYTWTLFESNETEQSDQQWEMSDCCHHRFTALVPLLSRWKLEKWTDGSFILLPIWDEEGKSRRQTQGTNHAPLSLPLKTKAVHWISPKSSFEGRNAHLIWMTNKQGVINHGRFSPVKIMSRRKETKRKVSFRWCRSTITPRSDHSTTDSRRSLSRQWTQDRSSLRQSRASQWSIPASTFVISNG